MENQTFETFKMNNANYKAYDVCKYCVEFIKEKAPIFYLYGKTKSGKTHLLNAVEEVAKEKKKQVKHCTLEEMLKEVKVYDEILNENNANASNKVNKYVKELSKNKIILIDNCEIVEATNSLYNFLFELLWLAMDNNVKVIMASQNSILDVLKNDKWALDRYKGMFHICEISPYDEGEQILNLKICYEANIKMKAKMLKDYVVWNKTDYIEIDRKTEKFIQNWHMMDGVIIKKDYYIKEGTSSFLDDLLLEQDSIFTEFQKNHKNKEKVNPLNIEKYKIEITYKNKGLVIIDGNFSRQGLPKDFEYVMNEIYDFLQYYGIGDLLSYHDKTLDNKRKK